MLSTRFQESDSLHRYFSIMVLYVVCLVGCGQQAASTSEQYPSIPVNQIASTLRQIEKTGEFQAVLPGLSGSMEQAGFMNEAARIQEFTVLPEDRIKKLAGTIATEVERAQKAKQ